MNKVYNPMTNMLEVSKKQMVKDAGWSQVKTIKRMVYEDVEDMLDEKDIKIAKNNGWLKGDKIIIPAGQKAKVKGQQIVFEKGGLDLDFYDTTSFEVMDSKDAARGSIKNAPRFDIAEDTLKSALDLFEWQVKKYNSIKDKDEKKKYWESQLRTASYRIEMPMGDLLRAYQKEGEQKEQLKIVREYGDKLRKIKNSIKH